MKSAKRFLVIIALASSLCASSLSAQGSRDGWLLVDVRDANGQPLARACVTVVPRDGEIAFSQCNRKGKVKFKGLARGDYRVVVKVEGYEAQKREVKLSAKEETIAFSLQPRKL
ncbi:MAG: Carboxypeptidase regulatory-like domain [Blastocatellia bacterium]|jgi:hypothetical protein|nr:Carboxypeptidase regulatory-like domain [Blastocatellia bacterium]